MFVSQAVQIRPIGPADATLLEDGLRRLSPESVRRRFLAPKARFSSRELRYLTDVDGVDHVALVAVFSDDPTRLAAVARFIRDPENPETAEMAVVVADDLQGQGLGRRMGLALADEARERGITRFSATLLSDNVAAHRLFAAISGRLTYRHSHGVEELVAELAVAA